MLSLILEFHNIITAPMADYFLHQKNCPPSVTFGNNFHQYFYVWFLFLLTAWSGVYYVFKHITRRFLRRIGLTVSRARRTAAALWCAGAGLGSSMLSASQLHVSPWEMDMHFDPESMPPPPHVSMYLTVLATCLTHRLIAGCIRRGFTKQTLADLLQLTFIPATYLARWPELGFSVMLLISMAQVTLELGRLCWSIKKGLDYASTGFFYIYCLVWSCVYLVALPAWLIAVATTPMESREHQMGLALLFLSMGAHIIVSYTFSPLVSAVKIWFFNCPFAEWLEAALFPGTDQAMVEMRKQAKEKRDSMEALALARKNSSTICPKRNLPTPTDSKKNNDAKALMQTVRCVTLLKRKIRAMREKKAQESAASLKGEEKTD